MTTFISSEALWYEIDKNSQPNQVEYMIIDHVKLYMEFEISIFSKNK